MCTYNITRVKYIYNCPPTANGIGWDDYILLTNTKEYSLKEMVNDNIGYSIEFSKMCRLPLYYLYISISMFEIEINYRIGNLRETKKTKKCDSSISELGEILLVFQDISRLYGKSMKLHVSKLCPQEG
jgi:hypothetical protein